jgi:hypothetical protein
MGQAQSESHHGRIRSRPAREGYGPGLTTVARVSIEPRMITDPFASRTITVS